MQKEPASDVVLMQCTFVAPSSGLNTQPFHQIKWTIVKWIVVDCLPFRTVETCAFRAMTRNLDPKRPDLGRKAITAQVGHCPKYCSVFASIFYMFFPSAEAAIVSTAKWKLWRAGLEK